MDIMGSLLALAAEQHNVVTRGQALALGFSASTIDRIFARQSWPSLHVGVRATPGSEASPLRAASAALLVAPAGAAVTGRTGLWLRGLLDAPPDRPVIVIPMQSTVPRTIEGVRCIPSRTIRPQDASAVRRLRIAEAARCFVDLCVSPSPTLDDITDDLLTVLQKRGMTIPQLRAQLRIAAGYPGLALLSRAVDDVTGIGADSPFARRVHDRLVRDGFDPDPFPEPLQTPQSLVHPDITFFRRTGKLASVECDGLAFHGNHRAQAKDARKDRAYRSVGCENRRIGWWDLRHAWDEFSSDLRDAIERAPTAIAPFGRTA